MVAVAAEAMIVEEETVEDIVIVVEEMVMTAEEEEMVGTKVTITSAVVLEGTRTANRRLKNSVNPIQVSLQLLPISSVRQCSFEFVMTILQSRLAKMFNS